MFQFCNTARGSTEGWLVPTEVAIENSRDMPDIDYETAGAKVIEFTHGNYVGKYKESRYGFLIGVVSKENAERQKYE